jgi:alpha-tubulin suppressor-like RCC1 family protein
VYCWGQRPWGTNQPVLGFGGLTPPSQLPVGPAQSVGVGESFGCALTLLRRVECWGLSGLGSLGVPGNTSGTFMIATVPTPENMTAIAVGQGHACALDGEGRAWCWGRSGEGQLGTTQEDQACGFEDRCLPTPASVAGDLRLAAIAAGRLHTCAIAIDGAAWCWGSNHMGQLGTGDLLDSREPRRVALGLSFTALALGSHHSCGLTGVGAIYCWGRGKEGELGDGMFTELSSTPVRVQGSAPFRSLSAGGLNTCAVQVNGPVMCWGDGTFNQLGRGSDQAAASTPTKWSGQP